VLLYTKAVYIKFEEL